MAYVVVVTGASGYIGTELTKQLLEKGYTVRGTVRNKNATEKVLIAFAFLQWIADDIVGFSCAGSAALLVTSEKPCL